jgi:hypothetical protein
VGVGTAAMSKLGTAITVFKLNMVRRVLAVLLRIHIWWELKQRGSHRPDMQGPDAEMENLIAIAKEKQRDDRKL